MAALSVTAQEQFWKWFTEHDSEIFDFESDREQVFDRIIQQLCRVHPDLVFEIGPKGDTREFIVSAAGIKSAFPAVTALVAAAPKLKRWKVVAFRQRGTCCGVEFHGKHLEMKDVQFTLFHDGENPGLYVFIPGYKEGDSDFLQMAYLLLDEALGEYDVESLGAIKMLPPETRTDGKRYPLPDLPKMFDEFMAQLGLRSVVKN